MAVSAQQVTVGTSATQLSVADTDAISGESLAIYNGSGSTVYLGGSGVTTGAGFPLATGTTLTVDLTPGSSLYAIAASSVTISVLAVGV